MSKSYIASEVEVKLERFAYPPQLCEVVFRFTKHVNDVFSNQELGILLVGSSARGELSWAENAGKIDIFSDIEFLIAIPNKNKKNEIKLRELISRLELEYDFGDLFHIDYTVIAWKKIPKLEKKFFIFESKQCGIDLGNASISQMLPSVTRLNINWKELNEVLLHRLTSMLHAMPLSFLSSTMSKEEEQTFGLNIAKNTLDITTWLHPYESNELIAGFTFRLAAWDERFLKQSKLGSFLSIEDIAYMKKCLSLRAKPYSSIDIIEMLSQTISIYNKAIAYCIEMNDISQNKKINEFRVSSKLFDEYVFKQRAIQFVSMIKNVSSLGVFNIINNIINVRKGTAINVSLYLLMSALNYKKNHENANLELKNAKIEFFHLSKVPNHKYTDFVEDWCQLRACFKQYQNISYVC